jgi:plasmid stabilization system protein ParE
LNEKLEQAIRDLLTMPGKGHLRQDVKDAKYRFWTVRPYVIAYRYDERALTVVRVVHGARDLRKLFRR